MSYRGAITDIEPGSLWVYRANRALPRVRILAAADGYVAYHPGGANPMREREFRIIFEPVFQRFEKYRSQFQMSLANLGAFRAYWVQERLAMPNKSPLVARSISCSRRFALPAEAILIGTYSHPCRVEAFFDDLDDVIASIERRPELAAAL